MSAHPEPARIELDDVLRKIAAGDWTPPVELDRAFFAAKFGEGHMVNMNSHAEVSAQERIYTAGLGGCRCSVATRGDRVQLAHYCELTTHLHVAALRAFQPEVVLLWTLGEYAREGACWVMRPNPVPAALAVLCTQVFGYSPLVVGGENRTVVFDNGRITAFGVPMEPSDPVAVWHQTQAAPHPLLAAMLAESA